MRYNHSSSSRTIRLRWSAFGILCLFSVYGVANAQGDAFLQAPGAGEAWFYAGFANARNYYNSDGNQRLFDSLQTSFQSYTVGLAVDYGLLDRLELNVGLPIGYYSISSDGLFPDRSIFSPAWFGIGLTYQVTETPIATSVSSQIKIPPGFHDGIYDDPNHATFLSDGYFQFTNTLNVAKSFDEIWVKGSIGYNARAEEPADEIIYSAQLGLARVEGTGLYLGVSGALSTEDVSQPLRPFYAGSSGSDEDKQRLDGGTGTFRTIDRENYTDIRPGFFIELGDRFIVSTEYFIRIAGANTLSLKGLNAALGYRF